MLKKRLIPILYIKNGLIVRSESFSIHQDIGNIINQANRYNEWDVDELIYIDISREKEYDLRRDDHKIQSYSNIEEIIKRISKVCFMPLTFGGGIRTMEDIEIRVENGADKITLNSAFRTNRDLVKRAAEKYGTQCIVASIDYRIVDKTAIVFTDSGRFNTSTNVMEWVEMCISEGCGEILLNCIDRDGKANGYDLPTLREVAESAGIPVIAAGGVGDFYDFIDVFEETNVSAAAAGNIFHFTERSYPRAKKLLNQNKINVR